MKKLILLILFTPLMVSARDASFSKFPVPKKGGVFTDALTMTPVTLNPVLSNAVQDGEVYSNLLLPLMETDAETYGFLPSLAEKVSISADRKIYTYTLRSTAKWFDGTPVTTEDFQFTFEKIMDPKIDSAPLRSYFGGVKFEKIDSNHFKFTVAKPRYNTQIQLNSFIAIQKKQFENVKDFNKAKENLNIMGNGPYKLKSISRDQIVIVEKNANWWAKDLPEYRNRFNFDEIQYKIISDSTLRYETFIKGGLDTTLLSSDQFVTQARAVDLAKVGDRPNSGKKVWADKFMTEGPSPWFGVALNQKNAILRSKKTRQGLAYLVNYPIIIEKAFFNTVEKALSPFGAKSDNTAPELKIASKQYQYDFQKGLALLKADGWVLHEEDNLLHKKSPGGDDLTFKLSFKFIGAALSHAKSAQILKESFKKAGIDLELKALDGASFGKDFDDKNFEAIFFVWGGGTVEPDVQQIWHSSSIDGGSNKVGFSHPEVDRLIDQANVEFDLKKRHKLLQQINRILYDEVPYIFMLERPYVLQGINSRVQSPVYIQRFGTSVAKDLFHF